MEGAMSRTLLPLSLIAALASGVAFADVPRVATDITPVHSLVSRVMSGLGVPGVIIQPGASPHEYALRPSEARTLQEADLVFWVGPDLTPSLGDTIRTIAPEAIATALLDTEGTIALEVREGALFEKHEHHGGEHDDHEEHAEHDDHEEHDDHDEHDDHADHGHDAHAWLSPQNAATWLNVIAGKLSAADPENAGTYFANAAAGREELQALTAEINAMLEPVRDGRFIVFHDAYQYFETDFDFAASGAISIGDASDPSPARIGEIRERVAAEGIDCVLTEPQFNAGLVAAVLDGSQAQTEVLDPLGSNLEPGPTLYPQMIRQLATALTSCLQGAAD
jgi:zinc transport system substrate-binding protein